MRRIVRSKQSHPGHAQPEEDSQFRSIKHARRINRKRSQIAEDAKRTYETAPNDRSVTHKYKEFLRIEARLAAATDAYLGDR